MFGPEASEPGETILDAGVGAVVEPDDDPGRGARELADHILELKEDDDRRRRLGRRSREVFLERVEKEDVCWRWGELLRRRLGNVVSA